MSITNNKQEKLALENNILLNFFASKELKQNIPPVFKDVVFFVINLDESVERLNTLLNSLIDNEISVNIERIPACNGRSILTEQKQFIELIHPKQFQLCQKKERQKHSDLSWGAVGCAVSHYMCFEKFMNDPNYQCYKYLVILEDDTIVNCKNSHLQKKSENIFLNSFSDLRQKLESQLKNTDWDGAQVSYFTIFESVLPLSKDFVRLKSFVEANGIMYHREGIKRIAQNFFPLTTQFDWYLSIHKRIVTLSEDHPTPLFKRSKYCATSTIKHIPPITATQQIKRQQ